MEMSELPLGHWRQLQVEILQRDECFYYLCQPSDHININLQWKSRDDGQ